MVLNTYTSSAIAVLRFICLCCNTQVRYTTKYRLYQMQRCSICCCGFARRKKGLPRLPCIRAEMLRTTGRPASFFCLRSHPLFCGRTHPSAMFFVPPSAFPHRLMMLPEPGGLASFSSGVASEGGECSSRHTMPPGIDSARKRFPAAQRHNPVSCIHLKLEKSVANKMDMKR